MIKLRIFKEIANLNECLLHKLSTLHNAKQAIQPVTFFLCYLLIINIF